MLGLGLALNKRNKGKGVIVKDGLVLHLDGKDFTNYPPTSIWKDKSPLGNNATPSGFGYIAPYAPITSDLAGTNQNVIEYSTGDGKVHYEVEGETLDIYNGGVKADFVGKVSGSVVENPNIYKVIGRNSLAVPSDVAWLERGQGNQDTIKTLDANTDYKIESTNTIIPQQLFSFDLIKIYERKYGVIPSVTQSVADKIVWLKANVTSIPVKWYGYGSCPSGNKAYLKIWDGVSAWIGSTNNTSSTPTLLSRVDVLAIDANGFVHFLAYTDMASTTSPTLLVLSGHGLAQWDVIENVTKGIIVDVTVVGGTDRVITNSVTGQVSGDVINKFHSSTTKVSTTGTTDTTIIITNHGLSTGDIIKNTTRGYVIRKVTVVDANTLTITSVVGQTSGDTFYTYKYYGQQTAESTVIPSTIYTDYVSLDITLKPSYKSVGEDLGGAGVHKVDVLSRGKNFINPSLVRTAPAIYVDIASPIGNVVLANNQYTYTSNSSGIGYRDFGYNLQVKPNTNYMVSAKMLQSTNVVGTFTITVRNSYCGVIASTAPRAVGTLGTLSFNSGTSNSVWIEVYSNGDNGTTFTSIMNVSDFWVEEGTVATPYVPYTQDTNSLALAQPLRKVSATVFDKYAEGSVSRNISNWVTLDGSLSYLFNLNYTGYKHFSIPRPSDAMQLSSIVLLNNIGQIFNSTVNGSTISNAFVGNSQVNFYIPNVDTGFVDSYTPTANEVKAYFYGWKMCMSDGATWDGVATKYWKKITDGTGITATLPTATYSGYTPYKMLYQLATPTTETITVPQLNGFANGSLLVDSGVVATKTNLLTSLLSATSGSWKPLDVDMPTLPNGVKNDVVGGSVVQKVQKVVLNGSETWGSGGNVGTNTLCFQLLLGNNSPGGASSTKNCSSDKFLSETNSIQYSSDVESICSEGTYKTIRIRILKSKLTTQDIAGFKAWLQANPTTVYYELATPIVGSISLGGKTSVEILNGANLAVTSNVLGSVPQIKVKFNLINFIESKYGTLPCASDLASKVAWVKGNMSSIDGNSFAYGINSVGNNANITVFSTDWSTTIISNSSSSPTVMIRSSSSNLIIDNNGYAHYNIYTKPTNTNSSGVFTPSTINMDYVSLQVSFKTPSGSDGLGGIVFDGVDDKFNLGLNPSLFATNQMTIEFKINPKNVTVVNEIYSSWGNPYAFRIFIISGNLSLQLRDDTATDILSTQLCPMVVDVPVTISISFDYTNNTLTTYKNNISMGTISIPIGVRGKTFITPITPFYIGYKQDSGGYSNFNINNFRKYNRILSDIERTRNYKATR